LTENNIERLKMLAQSGDQDATMHLLREALRRGEVVQWYVLQRDPTNSAIIVRREVHKSRIIEYIGDAIGVVLCVPAWGVEKVFSWDNRSLRHWILDCFEVRAVEGKSLVRYPNMPPPLLDRLISIADIANYLDTGAQAYLKTIRFETVIYQVRTFVDMRAACDLTVIMPRITTGPSILQNRIFAHLNQVSDNRVSVIPMLNGMADVFGSACYDASLSSVELMKPRQLAMAAFNGLMFDRLLGGPLG